MGLSRDLGAGFRVVSWGLNHYHIQATRMAPALFGKSLILVHLCSYGMMTFSIGIAKHPNEDNRSLKGT